jgi:hypothetical protein
MKLKRITQLTLVSISYLFTIRTVNTFLPGIFTAPALARAVQILSLAANLILLAFFFLFLLQFVQKNQKKLHFASLLGIASSTVMSFLYLRGLFLVFPGWTSPLYNSSPVLYQIFHSPSLSANIPALAWFNTLIFLFFLLSFFNEVKGIEATPLKKATYHAILGISLLLLIQTLLLGLQLAGGGLGWMLPFSFWISALLFPVFMIVFILKFNFFLNLYRILP